jgi:hypothetical protein
MELVRLRKMLLSMREKCIDISSFTTMLQLCPSWAGQIVVFTASLRLSPLS